MKNENQNILEVWEQLPKHCFTLQGIVFPKCQLQEVLTAWFRGEPLPTPKKP